MLLCFVFKKWKSRNMHLSFNYSISLSPHKYAHVLYNLPIVTSHKYFCHWLKCFLLSLEKSQCEHNKLSKDPNTDNCKMLPTATRKYEE